MTLYLLNSPILTDHGLWRFAPLTLEAARAQTAQGFVSAVGHRGAAEFMSRLLQVPVPVNRIRVSLRPGDRAIVLRLLARLPEGAVLDADAMERVPWELSLLERLE